MPGVHCVVSLCKNKALSKNEVGEKVSFHKFPKDEHLRKRWIQFCRREKSFNPNTSCICSKHFTKSDYENSEVEFLIKKELNMGVKKKLKSTACPSILQINLNNNMEHVELLYEAPKEQLKHDSSNGADDKDDLDLQIVSRRDLENLKKNYQLVIEENAVLQKNNDELQKTNKIQEEKIKNLSKQLLAVKKLIQL